MRSTARGRRGAFFTFPLVHGIEKCPGPIGARQDRLLADLGPQPRPMAKAEARCLEEEVAQGQDDQGPRPGGQARVRNLRLTTLLVPAGVPRIRSDVLLQCSEFHRPQAVVKEIVRQIERNAQRH